MKCPECGSNILEGAKFCIQCGTRVRIANPYAVRTLSDLEEVMDSYGNGNDDAEVLYCLNYARSALRGGDVQEFLINLSSALDYVDDNPMVFVATLSYELELTRRLKLGE